MIKKAITYVFWGFLLTLVLFAVRETSSNNPFSVIRHNGLQKESSIGSNTLVFKVNYLGLIPAGEARIQNKGEEMYLGRRVYHLSASVSPLEVYSKIFKVDARIDSYIDADKLYTLKFRQKLSIPNKPRDEKEVLYNQDKNFMELKGVKRQILPRTQDPLSAIFYIRRQDLKPGKEFDLNINTNQKNYQLYAKVLRREEYTTETSKVGVWVLEALIRRRDKNPYHKTTMKLWLLDNPSKTLIFIKAMTNIGQVTARLTAIE